MPPFRRPRDRRPTDGASCRRSAAIVPAGRAARPAAGWLPVRPGAAAVPAVQTPPRPGRSAGADGTERRTNGRVVLPPVRGWDHSRPGAGTLTWLPASPSWG